MKNLVNPQEYTTWGPNWSHLHKPRFEAAPAAFPRGEKKKKIYTKASSDGEIIRS